MSISETVINGELYYTFIEADNIKVGKCIVVFLPNHTIHLKYIEIFTKYRGNDFSTKFWRLVEKSLYDKEIYKITLMCYELDEKCGKLVRLYQSWGFIIDGESRYEYNGDYLMRKTPMSKILKVSN